MQATELVLKPRPRMMYVTCTKAFMVSFDRPVREVAEELLAAFGIDPSEGSDWEIGCPAEQGGSGERTCPFNGLPLQPYNGVLVQWIETKRCHRMV